MTKYQPIGCAFYDLIELFSVKRKKVSIKYLDSKQKERIVSAIIEDTLTSKEGEFIILKLGDLNIENKKLRMDHIVSIDDHIADDYNSCSLWFNKSFLKNDDSLIQALTGKIEYPNIVL